MMDLGILPINLNVLITSKAQICGLPICKTELTNLAHQDVFAELLTN
jgi:hypothetical protein